MCNSKTIICFFIIVCLVGCILSVTACPKCGSRKIFQGRLKDGVLTGYTNRYVCRNCGYQGFPVIFDSIEEYDKFLLEKKSGRSFDDSVENQILDDDVDLSDKDKEVVSFLNDIDENSVTEVKYDSSIRKIIFIFSIVLIFSLIITLNYVPVDFFLPAALVVFILFFVFYFIFRNKKG
jgi:hypothetical protein